MARKAARRVSADTDKALDDAMAQNLLTRRDALPVAILGVVPLVRCSGIALRGTPTGLAHRGGIGIDHSWSEIALGAVA